LGFGPSYLKDTGSVEEMTIRNSHYPESPHPKLTIGLTILFCEDQWFDITPVSGALVVNLGYMMQLITSVAFKSAYHRVLSRRRGSTISIGSFLYE
ncbi:hypothetical protein CICLE_v10006574mg, partial [Citrus x clementina]